MSKMRRSLTSAVLTVSALTGCGSPPNPDASTGERAVATISAPQVVHVQASPSFSPQQVLSSIGTLAKIFGWPSGIGEAATAIQTILQLSGIFDSNTNSNAQIEQGIQQIEAALTELLGVVVNKDKLDVLRQIDTYRTQSIEATDKMTVWAAHGESLDSIDYINADQLSSDALYQLATNVGIQERVPTAAEANWMYAIECLGHDPEYIGSCGSGATGITTMPLSQQPAYYKTADGGIWDFRMFLPSLMEAVIARLDVIEAKYPTFGVDATDAVEIEQIIGMLQPVADKIEAGNGCMGAGEGFAQVLCTNSLLYASTGEKWTAPLQAGALEAARAQRDLGTGLTQLRALIQQLKSYTVKLAIAPGCSYTAALQQVQQPSGSTISPKCTPDAANDPIYIFRQSPSGGWDQIWQYDASDSSGAAIQGESGATEILLGCTWDAAWISSQSAWAQEVTPGAVGCDPAPSSVDVPACVPLTLADCATLSGWGPVYGRVGDGCGGWMDCPACVPAATCASLHANCATTDNCGNPLDCGTCASGYACSSGTCTQVCAPKHCRKGTAWNPDDCACEPVGL